MADIERDGYAVLPRWLASADVEVVSSAVEELLADRRSGSCTRPNNTLVPLRWCDRVVGTVLREARRVRRLADAVRARDLRWISGYLSIKEPRSLPLWWHQDWWCWDHPVSYQRPPVQVALLCYLMDTDIHSGALRVLPGSHAASTPLHAVLPRAHASEATGLDRRHAAMTNQRGQVTLQMRAGDAVVMDYRLLHGTHANTQRQRRDGILLTFTPSWRTLPTEIRAHLISHPALPVAGEPVPSTGWTVDLLPAFDGPRRDLELSRDAPADFALLGPSSGTS